MGDKIPVPERQLQEDGLSAGGGTGRGKIDKQPVPELKLELANSIIHGIGVLFAVAAMPVLTIAAYQNNRGLLVAGTIVYSFNFLMVFAFSTLYHGFQQPLAKEAMKILDHISIYFLIAGSYTPFIFRYFNNPQGINMLVALWSLAGLGIFFKIFYVNRFRKLSVFIYVAMGWMLLWTGTAFFDAMPRQVIGLILAGNLLYSLGLVFYLWQRWAYHHAYWHTLVLLAAICHYTAVFMAVSN